MDADGQCQIRNPRQHGQRHQAGPGAVIDEPRFASRAEAADVPAHQAVHQPDEGGHQEQGQGQGQHQQPHEENQHGVSRRDQVALDMHVDLAQVVAEVMGLVVCAGVGLRPGIAYPVEQTTLEEHPVVGVLDEPARTTPRLLHEHAAREVLRDLGELVIEHALRMVPALLGPEEMQTDALDHDAQQQRAAQYAEEAKRQRDQTRDQALLANLLPLCGDGRVGHASASAASPAICLKSSTRSAGSAVSCRLGRPWFSHQSPAST